MDLDFDLQLAERQSDRVMVSVQLRPSAGPVVVEGVTVMLVCAAGEPLSHRLLLPIAGTLEAPIVSTVELRGQGPLPMGAKVAGNAWNRSQQWEVAIPADPGTQLRAHCQGRVLWRPERDPDFDVEFVPFSCAERRALSRRLPWLAPCQPSELRVMDDESEGVEREKELKDYCDGLGLDEEESAWLEDLLSE